jgi:hypothetical protein
MAMIAAVFSPAIKAAAGLFGGEPKAAAIDAWFVS